MNTDEQPLVRLFKKRPFHFAPLDLVRPDRFIVEYQQAASKVKQNHVNKVTIEVPDELAFVLLRPPVEVVNQEKLVLPVRNYEYQERRREKQR